TGGPRPGEGPGDRTSGRRGLVCVLPVLPVLPLPGSTPVSRPASASGRPASASGQVDPGRAQARHLGGAQVDPAEIVLLLAVVVGDRVAVAAAGDGARGAVRAHDQLLALVSGLERARA